MKSLCCALALLVSGVVFAAENLVKKMDGWKLAPVDAALSASEGTPVLRISKAKAWVFSPDWIKLDPAKTYTISMDLRSADAAALSKMNYIGLVCYDAARKTIVRDYVQAVPGSSGTVAADAPAGSSKIFMDGAVDLSARNAKKGITLVLNAKEDFSDLPNADNVGKIAKVEVVDGKTVFVLAKPLVKAVTAGTRVRCHYYMAGFTYGVLMGGLGAEWKTYSCRLSGIGQKGSAEYNEFWPGTDTFRLLLVVNNTNGVASEVLVKNISVTAE